MSIFKKETEALSYTVKDKEIKCGHCGNNIFHRSYSRIEPVNVFTFAPNPADCYICASCGHVEWFVPDEEKE